MRLAVSPFAAARALEAELRKRFDRLLIEPDEYRRQALEDCRPFPEGDLLPFTLPLLGYVNHALTHPEHAEDARRKAAVLIELAIPSVVKAVRAPGGRLEDLEDYGRQGVYLGWLGLAIGGYRLIRGDGRWDAIQKRIADVLHQALVEADGKPLWSYPDRSWPFDTAPCLLALRLYDHVRRRERSSLAIAKHLDWVRRFATDAELGLPNSWVDFDRKRAPGPPRGGDLAFRVCLLQQIDPAYAKELYAGFRRHYWRELGWLAGFSEWPHGQKLGEDIDSGPVFQGVGLAATGFGIGAALTMRDAWRLGRLCSELAVRGVLFPPLRSVLERLFPFDGRCLTGTLMGDASVFAIAGWREWGTSPAPWDPAADQRVAEAQYELGMKYARGECVTLDDAEAKKWLRKAAEQGYAEAQYSLGLMCDNGCHGEPEDDAEAAMWYREAAEQGQAGAQNNLGGLYLQGRGVPQDFAEARGWFQRAAEQGHAEAQCCLGLLYNIGRGVQQDFAEAASWLQKAAEQGHTMAQFNLGRIYANGRVGSHNNAEAVKWYRMAAEQGHADAQNALDEMRCQGRSKVEMRESNVCASSLENHVHPSPAAPAGVGGPVNADPFEDGLAAVNTGDYATALRLWRPLAELGDAKAQSLLGTMYANGHGVPQDAAAAIQWFRLAADQGDAGGQDGLGLIYAEGHGVSQDYVEAAKWYRLAAEQGFASAQYKKVCDS